MNGMHQEEHFASNLFPDVFTSSHDYELAPTPTLAQITQADYSEVFGLGNPQGSAILGFTSCAHVDASGVTHIDTLNARKVFGRNGLTRADFEVRVVSCSTSYVVNFFFWDIVF